MAYLVNVGFLLLFLFSCAPAAAEEVKFFDEVKIERFDGDQPWYRLTIKKTGSAEFERFDSPYLGNTYSRLTPQQLGEISEAIKSADFFSMQVSYSFAFHVPTVSISVTDTGRQSEVSGYAAFKNGQMVWDSSAGVKRVNELVLEIEEIAGVGKIVNKKPWHWLLMELAYWSIVGLPLCLLIFVLLRFKRRATSKGAKITVFLAVMGFSFLLVGISVFCVMARVSKHSIPSLVNPQSLVQHIVSNFHDLFRSRAASPAGYGA